MTGTTPHDRTARWLPLGAGEPGTARLFCFPFAGGAAASAFGRWPGLAPPDTSVCPVQLPGRPTRPDEVPHRDVDALLDDLVATLADRFVGRYALFGHSLGAIVAFELTRRLRADGATGPEHLFVSGRRAPHLPGTRRAIHGLPEPELVDELRAMGGTPPEVLAEPDLLELVLPCVRADLEISETYRYRPEPPLEVPLTAFGGDRDVLAEEPGVRAWAEHTTGPFEAVILPGGHFFLHEHPEPMLRRMSAATWR